MSKKNRSHTHDGHDKHDIEELPIGPAHRVPMLYKVGIICGLYVCSITALLWASGPTALQQYGSMLAGEENHTDDLDQVDDLDQIDRPQAGYTELTILECDEKVEIDQEVRLRFEVVNHLNDSHNYTYTISGHIGGGLDLLRQDAEVARGTGRDHTAGWTLIEKDGTAIVETSITDFPPGGYAGKITVTLDTGEETEAWVRRYEEFHVVIDPEPGILDKVWEASLGTKWDDSLAIRATKRGTYVLAGDAQQYDESLNLVLSDILIAEIDEEGAVLWQKLHQRSELESARDIAIAEDGGHVMAGRSFNGVKQQAYILRVNQEGDKVWEKAWGEDESSIARCITNARDGFIVAGARGKWTSSTQDMYVAKIDTAGHMVWEAAYGGDEHDSGHRIAQCTEGGYLVAGFSDSFGTSSSSTRTLRLIYLVRITEDGDLIWEEAHGHGIWNEPHAIIETDDRGFLIIGKTSTGYHSDAYVLRIDRNGQKIWERFYSGHEDSCFKDAYLTPRGTYLLGGYTYVARGGPSDAVFVEIDDSGQTLWQTSLKDVSYSGMACTTGGDIILSSGTDTAENGTDVSIFRYRFLEG